MDKKSKDTIPMIRTRGVIQVRSAEEANTSQSGSVHSRGGIKTRGGVAKPPPSLKRLERPVTVDKLIMDVRPQLEDLPLAVVLHGWPCQSDRAFIARLQPFLMPEDAVWLVGASANAGAATELQVARSVLLDLN